MLLRSDLDWIVMRCLEKDRDRRWASFGPVKGELQEVQRAIDRGDVPRDAGGAIAPAIAQDREATVAADTLDPKLAAFDVTVAEMAVQHNLINSLSNVLVSPIDPSHIGATVAAPLPPLEADGGLALGGERREHLP